MNSELRSILLSGTLIVLLSQCGLFEPSRDETHGSPEIEFIVSGGFWGGIIEHLIVSKKGVVTLKSGYPELSLSLTKAQHDSILALILQIRELERTSYFFSQHVADDIEIEIRIDQKTFLASYSYIYDHREEQGIDLVYLAVDTLHDLKVYTYEQSAPWIGLVFDAAPAQSIYTVGDTIKVIYSLSNPTGHSRALLFPHQNKIRFQAEGGNCSGYCYLYPSPSQELVDDSPPSSINIESGKSWQMVFPWAQPYEDHHGVETILEPGTYEIGMNMANGNFNPKYASIEVIESITPNDNLE